MAKLVPAQVLKCEKPSLNRLGSFFLMPCSPSLVPSDYGLFRCMRNVSARK